MKISVIIPAHNAAETIADTIESLLAQTVQNWEAIVVDDGSVDQTAEVVTRYAEQDGRFCLIHQSQGGVCAARNTGIQQARGEWLLFLDADDWILPTHLEQLANALTIDPDLDAIYSRWARVTEDGRLFEEGFLGQVSDLFPWFAHNCIFAIHTCLVRRAIVTELGGFDPSFRTCEDWDLWQRIARMGARFGSISNATARYRMRSTSASANLLQLLQDGLRVIANGHAADPRVPHPSPAYANGMPAFNLSGAKLDYVCWTSGLVLGHGGDPLTLLSAVEQERDPGLSPELLAQYLFKAPLLPTCQPLSAWSDLWTNLENKINKFLDALEAKSTTPYLAQRVRLHFKELILNHCPDARPFTVDTTYAVTVEVTEPISDITVPTAIDRLNCHITVKGTSLGTITLPVCDGVAISYVLKDAIASEFSWSILGQFFQQTIYPTLTLKRTDTGTSVWRDSHCLAEGLPEYEQERAAVLHDRVGWTVFLQELWGLPEWANDAHNNGYRQKGSTPFKTGFKDWLTRKGIIAGLSGLISPCSRVQDGWLSIEVSQSLMDGWSWNRTIHVVPKIGGVALGMIPVQTRRKRIRAQALRTAITNKCGLELVVAAVREGLVGQPFDERPLRSRLAASAVQNQAIYAPITPKYLAGKAVVFAPGTIANLNSILSSHFASDTPSDIPDHIPSNISSNITIILARHAGELRTRVSRRAMFPIAAMSELIETATVAHEPILQIPDTAESPTRVIYAPDLIWRTPNPTTAEPIKPTTIARSAQAYGRNHFETLFATQPDPWKYTNSYEQTKYEQTLDLLPESEIDRALELACAEGHFTVQLAPRVKDLLAADISQIALDRAADRCSNSDLQNVQFILHDLANDPISAGFDLIVCSEVLYYMGDLPRLQKVADKIAAALKPGGYFLTAHAHLVVDEPDRPGYNWNHPFGAKVIGETFANTSSLHLVKELRTPLYRIQLFQKDISDTANPITPEIIERPQPTAPPPQVADTILWQGGIPHGWEPEPIATSQLPILMYHRVAPTGAAATARYRVTPEAFEQQLRYLSDAGFYSTTLEAWQTAKATKTPLPGRAVLLTFDDGYQDFLTHAFPLLQRYGFSAIVFLVTGKIGQSNDWDAFYGEDAALLNWEEIRTLQQAGIELGSHSVSHAPMTGLSLAEIVKEGARSRATLQRELGIVPKAFAYPYGDTDSVVQHFIGACGYGFGLSCKAGLSNFQDSLLALPRIEVTGFDGLKEFVTKLTPDT